MFLNASPAGHRSSPLAFVMRAFGARWTRRSAAISVPAQTTLPTRKSDGAGQMPAPSVNLKARALRLYNRNSKAASAYERIHTILGAGRADH